MKIASFLRPESVVAELTSFDKNGILNELAQALSVVEPAIDQNKVFKALAERERLGSTGIGSGVAIPHAKIPGINKIYGAFGRHAKGIDFDSNDGESATLFFMLIAPRNSVVSHLAALERVNKMLQEKQNREDILAANADDLYDLICRLDEEG